MISFATDYDPEDEVQRLRGTRWKIDPSLGEVHIDLNVASSKDEVAYLLATVPSRSDPSLRRMVEKILPLATFFTAVKAFVELRSVGTFLPRTWNYCRLNRVNAVPEMTPRSEWSITLWAAESEGS